MPETATKATPTYLKEARLQAGYANRGTASAVVSYSPEVIGRHERGDSNVDPDDAVVYAERYHRQDILYRYCADCPVGRATGRQVTERELPFATLRLTQRLRRAAKEIADTLEAIADDGIVDEHERPTFDASLAHLKELGETISDIFLYAALHKEIKRAAPVAPGSDSLRK